MSVLVKRNKTSVSKNDYELKYLLLFGPSNKEGNSKLMFSMYILKI